jgi:uncharacterized lipoprotein YddW (UPF0748 family)
MAFRLGLVLVCCMAVSGVHCASLPEIMEADHEVFDDIGYSQAEAQKLWVPLAGSKDVSVIETQGGKTLELAVNFSGTGIDRVGWDRGIPLNLNMCKGVEFLFYSEDISSISQFVMYFHSGDGWYACSFVPEKVGEWTRVRVEKKVSQIEGRPAGWGKVDKIRLSAWRGSDRDAKFYIRNIGRYGTGAKILIVRGDSAATTAPTEIKSVDEYGEIMAGFLDSLGLSYFVISDEDFTADEMKGRELVILPFNPAMPEKNAAQIKAFVTGGGKLLACYTLPKELEEAVGIKVGAHIEQERSGQFDSIRAVEQLRGQWPSVAKQKSWNIREGILVEGRSNAAAWWYDDKGEPTGKAAVVVSDNCVYLTHVLLNDDAINKQCLLLSMVGSMVPELWREATIYCIGQVGRVGGFEDYESAREGILQSAAEKDAAMEAMNRADELYAQSRSLLSAGSFSDAITNAKSARELMIEGYCRVQKPVWPEHRAFWCHSAFGVAGMDWDEAIRRLSENGFTAILPNMLWGGVAFYKSEVLPVSDLVAERGDQIELCVKACKKYGVECHVWKVNFNMGWAASRDFRSKMKEGGRTQVKFDGSGNDRWLCPSHPENRKLEIESMVEVARKYEVEGVHFDYIRYPDENGCFCNGCRERFEKWAGVKVGNWPGDVRADKTLEDKWLEFRRTQITPVVKGVAEGAREIRDDIKISAAVFRNWPSDRNTIGQDWRLWCEQGWLDFVCPMNYTDSSGQFERMTREQLKWVGDVPCYPGIGLSVWRDSKDICKLIEQIGVTRKLGTGGFTVFNYGPVESREMISQLGLGLTQREVSEQRGQN